ncbi:MAG: transpeptidase family protein [Bryobacteraceae bacterium]|nr:transpeptidase family protein [Bryobacteraceae bacterium]
MEPTEGIHSTRRLRYVARAGVIWALVIFGKLIYFHVYLHPDLRKAAQDQYSGATEIPAPRGRIYDREGRNLAISVPAESIAINPKLTPDIDIAGEIFAPLLDLDPEQLQERLAWATENRRGFLWIKRRVTPEESAKIRGLKLGWVEYYRDSIRRYPKGALAANLIGSVNHAGAGNSGLELSLDKELSGKPGRATRLLDAQGRTLESTVVKEPRPGQDFGISIDERIQFMADRELATGVRENSCRLGSIVVLNPRTGEILAMSSWPTFDPNAKLEREDDQGARLNQAISAPFEPGSVFKVFTLSAALETTRLSPESLIDCGPGVMTLFGRRIRDIHAYNTIPMEKVLVKSSNIGAIKVGLQVGEERLYEYITRFGFGTRTGIPLPAESPGKLRALKGWQKTSIGSIAMGHELSATSLQLALAVSAIANDGVVPKPRLILWRQEPGSPRKEEPVAEGRRAIGPETAVKMRQMMERVVLEGTGRAARLIGYTAGGKTGSAQIFDPAIRRYTHRYNASFVGFAPIQNPSVVVAVTLNGASRYGGLVAAPVFQRVSTEALRILGVIPDVPPEGSNREAGLTEEEAADLPVADLTAAPAFEEPKMPADVRTALNIPEHDVLPVALGSSEETPIEAAVGSGARADAQPATNFVVGPEIPNFKGKSLRAVLRECSRLKVDLDYSGAGLARWQYPPAGSVLPAGERVRVIFAR